MVSRLKFPTALHQQVAELVNKSFMAHPQVDTVLVVNSCARGQAVPESDLDVAILVSPTATTEGIQGLETSWQKILPTEAVVLQFKQSSRFAQVHLDFFNGEVTPTVWDDGGGPDTFELEIGNRVAYGAPMSDAGIYFRELQSRWLPYYDEHLRLHRLSMVTEACAHDLERIPYSVTRGLYFHAFDCLYKAFQEFLQALFIKRRTYPLAYNKWIREQVEGWLGLPEVYRELPTILSVRNIESSELCEKANSLRALLERWVQS